MLHHDLKKLDNHLGGGSDQHLPLSTLLCVIHGLEGIVQDTDAHHPARRPLSLTVQSALPKEGKHRTPPTDITRVAHALRQMCTERVRSPPGSVGYVCVCHPQASKLYTTCKALRSAHPTGQRREKRLNLNASLLHCEVPHACH